MKEIATLGGGCFWCIEAVFSEVKGVDTAYSGFSGGDPNITSYEAVCSGISGHAEVVQITFDNSIVSYEQLLQIFFTVHNPTTLNRQGNDVGTQYRSAIYYHNEEQKEVAEKVMKQMSSVWDDPIVTEVSPFDKFFKAEEYHQNYFEKNPTAGYCQIIIAPKVSKFRKQFTEYLKN